MKRFLDVFSGRAEEEAYFPQVHVPRRRPRPAAGHEQRAADGAVSVPHQEEVLARPQEEADGAHQEAQEEEEGGASQREAGRCQDAPPGHDHRSRDDGLRRRSLQREDL